MSQIFSNNRAVLISAVVSSSITLGAMMLYQAYTNSNKQFKKTDNKNTNSPSLSNNKKDTKDFPKELINEQLARNRAFLGEDAMDKIQNSYVIVVGAGGVGSWAATMLVRSGVGKVKIVDFDQVSLSSLNRHACAAQADVGSSKVECVANYLRSVAPFVEIEPVTALWNLDVADEILQGNPDFVIDAIDNIDTKVDLLSYCHQNGLTVISAMGAGCKADPTRVKLADISASSDDPLSRCTRRRLRARGISTGIPVVFSSEKPGREKAQLLSLDASEADRGDVGELAVLPDFRVRVLPVLGPLPAIFGLTIATHILNDLGSYSAVFDPLQGGYSMAGKSRHKLYESALQSLVGQFARLNMPQSRDVPITTVDAEYIIEEIFHGRSPISGDPNRLVLSMWDPNAPVSVSNLIPVTKDQQAYHEKTVLKTGTPVEEAYSPQVLQIVNKRFKEEAWYSQFR